MLTFDPDAIAQAVLTEYSRLSFRPPDGKFTVLSAFVIWNTSSGELKVISLGTGSKCLPKIRLCKEGDVIHDSHAEVLARRGAIRWLTEEVMRLSLCGTSNWIERLPSGRLGLKGDIRTALYVSTVPCGDASMRYLAAFQDAEMASLKNSSDFPVLAPGTASRGRDNYSLFGVLRTKPGRADSPPTLCMSCSDKIASWSVTGFQGALSSCFLMPLYINSVVIGDVEETMREAVLEDCNRAFWKRLEKLENVQFPPGYFPEKAETYFTNVRFSHSSLALGVTSSCNDSLCYTADSTTSHEVLINGMKRGVPPKHRHNPKFRPVLSKLSLFNLYRQVAGILRLRTDFDCYHKAKQSSQDYQTAKRVLCGSQGPFAGWIKTGFEWECFDYNGVVQETNPAYDDSAKVECITSTS